MRFALVLSVVLAALAVLLVLVVAFFRGIPDASAPAPGMYATRRVAVGPPASLRARLKARLRVCPRIGHAFAVAYPMPGSQRVRQCQRCGKVEAPVVVKDFRTERA